MMFCQKCGTEVPDGMKICPKCGAQMSSDISVSYSQEPQRAPRSVAGFVCGLLGFLLDWFPIIGLVLSIVGVSLCNKGLKEVKNAPHSYKGSGFLTAGKVLGILGIIAGAIVLLITLVWCIILGNGGFFTIMNAVFNML